VLSVLQSPGFRPAFKWFSWYSSLFGWLMCTTLMLVISWEVRVYMLLYIYNIRRIYGAYINIT
jgi:hypothetical protein